MTRLLLFIISLLLLLAAACSPTQPVVQLTPVIDATEEDDLQVETPLLSETPKPSQAPTHSPNDSETQVIIQATPTVVDELTASPTALPQASATTKPRPTLAPGEWENLPVVPEISDTVVQIYQQGLVMGNNASAFSKIGDCGSTPAWFLGDFDRGPDFYSLGEYQDLADVIQVFEGSYGRTSLAAKSGYNASSLFVALWADREYCESNETPLACEYRVHRPMIAFIMLGSNDVYHPDEFEPQMRKIIEFSIANGVVPILATKADNEEGDGSINATIARLAFEYDIPLWNFWLAVQQLPDHGLQEDSVHLTWGRNFFDKEDVMSKAWPMRNLTALQVLDAVLRKASGQSE